MTKGIELRAGEVTKLHANINSLSSGRFWAEGLRKFDACFPKQRTVSVIFGPLK